MAEEDGYVQVATDGAGKKIDNSELDREASLATGTFVAGPTVYRQRVAIGDPTDHDAQARVSGERGRGSLEVEAPTLGDIHAELVQIREVLQLLIGS